MSVTEVQRSIRQTRRIRVAAFVALALNALMFAVNIAVGTVLAAILAPISAAAVIGLLALIVWQTRLIGTYRERERELRELVRPRMTPEDWRRLREMEAELGWELTAAPDEPLLPETGAERDVQRAMRDLARAEADRDRAYREAKARQHAPTGSAPMTGPGGRWHPVSELAERDARAAEAAEHFAALARAGRESCPGFCPICEERWIEKGRWGK
jgi:hypothetical protein